MTKQILNKSLAAFALVLMTSAVNKSFALTTPTLPTVHSLSAGQSGGGGNPDPTDGGGGGNFFAHAPFAGQSGGGGNPDPTDGGGGGNLTM